MKKRNSVSQPIQKRRGTGVLIGRAGAEKILAVEGIKLTPVMKERAAEFDRKGLTPEQRIRAIVAAYRKG